MKLFFLTQLNIVKSLLFFYRLSGKMPQDLPDGNGEDIREEKCSLTTKFVFCIYYVIDGNINTFVL